MERVATGVKGFDEMVEGGLPKNSNIILTGVPGSGKTIFGLQYLYEGAKKGEKGVYISLDSSIELLKIQAAQFGWDIAGMEKEGKIFFLRVPLTKMKFNIFEMIDRLKKQINAQRIVFDSLATFAINVDLFTIPTGYGGSAASSVSVSAQIPEKISNLEMQDSYEPSENDRIYYAGNSEKRMIYLIIEELASLGTTNLIITYGNTGNWQITVDGVSEYACDGIIELRNELVGIKHMRTMAVLKMRDTKHSQYVHSFDITSEGIKISPAESVYNSD